MVTSVTSLGRSGLHDWVVQRASAVILAVYTVGLLGWFLIQPQVDFAAWQALNQCTAMRVANTLALLALIAHAWIGVWTILTDYVTTRQLGSLGGGLRLLLQAISFLWLFACLAWGAVIIWAGV